MKYIKLFEDYSEEDLNRVLDKISKQGVGSLNPDEKGYLQNYGTEKENEYQLDDDTNITGSEDAKALADEILKTYNHFPTADKSKLKMFLARPKDDGVYIVATKNDGDSRKSLRGTVVKDGNTYTLKAKVTYSIGSVTSEEDAAEFVVKNYNDTKSEIKDIDITFDSVFDLVESIISM